MLELQLECHPFDNGGMDMIASQWQPLCTISSAQRLVPAIGADVAPPPVTGASIGNSHLQSPRSKATFWPETWTTKYWLLKVRDLKNFMV